MTFAAITIMTGLLLTASTPAEDQGPPLAGSRPNIILVMTDDQGYANAGKSGHPWLKTPNLDSLAEISTRLTDFHVSPTCAPTRAALMSGRSPYAVGVTHTVLARERLAKGVKTMADYLREAGYTTGIFGKWHLGDGAEYLPGKRGFDHVFIHGAGGIGQNFTRGLGKSSTKEIAFDGADVPGNKYNDPVIYSNGTFVRTKGFCTDVFFAEAMRWIGQQKPGDKPFFAYIATNAPHGPMIATKKDKARFAKAKFSSKAQGFFGMIENIDANMGRLMECLKSRDLMKNTLLIFMTDNGPTMGGQGVSPSRLLGTIDGKKVYGYNAGLLGHKNTLEEGGTRTMGYMCWPGKLKEGRQIPQLVNHYDLLPTFMELAGKPLTEEAGMEGLSIVPLLEGKSDNWPDRMRAIVTGRWEYGKEPESAKGKFAVRNDRFRYVQGKLFDIEADPGQKKNVASKHPEVVKAMKEFYADWWKRVRPLMVNEKCAATEKIEVPFIDWYNKQKESTGVPDWELPEGYVPQKP